MIFLFSKKKIVLDCFTSDEQLLQTAPVTSAIKQIPTWWKTLPVSRFVGNDFFPHPTMKNCVGVVDYYKNSVALPMWSDLAIKVADSNYSWQYADRKSVAEIQDLGAEATGFLPSYGNLKLISPWAFKTKEDVSWVCSQPIYNFSMHNVGVIVAPGVLNFLHQHYTNINMMFPKTKNGLHTFEHGQVMMHLTPMSDRRIEIVRHLVSEVELSRLLDKPISFLKNYSKLIEKKHKFSDCAYHKDKNVTKLRIS